MDSDSRSYKNSRRKSVNKKVSFSMIEGGVTFDEIAKMRKLKEKELESFISNKKRTNQYISSLKNKNIFQPNINENNNNIIKKEENKNIIFNDNILNINNSSGYSSSININLNNNKRNFKQQMPIRFFLTDEDESKPSGILNSQNKINANKLNKNNIEKFVKIISNILYIKNNRNKRREIKKEIFNELMQYNDYLIKNNYLDQLDNDIEHKTFLENKKIFFNRKIGYAKIIQKIKKIKYSKLFNKKNNEEAKKFYLYTLYKKKVLAFEALKN